MKKTQFFSLKLTFRGGIKIIETTVHVVSAIVASNCQRGSREALQQSEGPELSLERFL